MTIFDYEALKCRGKFVRDFYGLDKKSHVSWCESNFVLIAVALLTLFAYLRKH
jgi:hypothetical protein